jgi:hypothetical protein
MSYLIDDVARLLATPMPRRKTLRLFGGALAGAFLASLGVRRADAALNVSVCGTDGGCKCGSGNKPLCPKGSILCGSSANCVCCTGTVKTCCGTNGQPVCCPGAQCCSKSTSTCTPSQASC